MQGVWKDNLSRKVFPSARPPDGREGMKRLRNTRREKDSRWDKFVSTLIWLEREAMDLELYATAHKITEAKQKAGWERAFALEKAMP
jgi:hypothetical protein